MGQAWQPQDQFPSPDPHCLLPVDEAIEAPPAVLQSAPTPYYGISPNSRLSHILSAQRPVRCTALSRLPIPRKTCTLPCRKAINLCILTATWRPTAGAWFPPARAGVPSGCYLVPTRPQLQHPPPPGWYLTPTRTAGLPTRLVICHGKDTAPLGSPGLYFATPPPPPKLQQHPPGWYFAPTAKATMVDMLRVKK